MPEFFTIFIVIFIIIFVGMIIFMVKKAMLSNTPMQSINVNGKTYFLYGTVNRYRALYIIKDEHKRRLPGYFNSIDEARKFLDDLEKNKDEDMFAAYER